ncbi:DUF7619 domain-containing protein [Flavobacterium okayamense]|uniref:Uncharacterized protein n=1 Tax=Flavobacterium okayamense TaxID=2830782 RepID=A0ABM7SCL0_9FLAO|nr:T9SS type A sorting domain-containing protein [Flavobacterium okayamense]BCY28932.1 hypothetical protein KK2020170_18000 [Flavobacterium okayamense]
MKKYYFILLFFVCFYGKAQIINFPDAELKLKLLSASPNNATAKDLNGNNVKIDTNNNNEIEVSEALQIVYLYLSQAIYSNNYYYNPNITDITGLEYFTNLKELDLRNKNIAVIDATPFIQLEVLHCGSPNTPLSSPLTTLNVTGLTNLQNLRCVGATLLTSVDVSTLTNLTDLWIYNTNITSLDVSNLTNLWRLDCSVSQISSLDVSNNINLLRLYCRENQITSLDVSNNINLQRLYCFGNQITNLDVSMLSDLNVLQCYDNSLTELNIKNGNSNSWTTLDFYDNPNLQFVCADEEDVAIVQQKIDTYGYTSTCHVNSYCSFTPGGTFYDITGNIKFDANNNGCDVGDINVPNLNLSISNGTTTGSLISDTTGDYFIPVQAGIYTVTPTLENPTYFTISPTNFVVDFPTNASPFLQDFCITANGVHSDVEVVIIPITPAIPGFDANYKIVYRNKGTEIENGNVSLTFDDAVLDYVSSNPVYDSSAPNTFNWNHTNLLPFETREIEISFNVNAPTDTPPVNIGDILNYIATISTANTDETPLDNVFTLNQTVVGSYDPNDKTCLEGETVDVATIGKYVHYVIRFENTGTYPAQNIVVKDMIDTSKFDVSTLVPLHGSHEFYTKIKDNKVEFIFENINLDFNDATNDGYVAFKIKTLPTLTVGETFTNDANIYFDYNYPITTNAFATTIQDVLSNQSFEFENEFVLYPNPTHDILNISTKNQIEIQSVEIYNIVGQIVIAVPNTTTSIDVSNIAIGTYLIKVNTEKGSAITKFLKN